MRILSGVSQQLCTHVKTKTFPNSIGAGSPLMKFNFGIIVGSSCISQINSSPQFWHFVGKLMSDIGAMSSGKESREYLKLINQGLTKSPITCFLIKIYRTICPGFSWIVTKKLWNIISPCLGMPFSYFSSDSSPPPPPDAALPGLLGLVFNSRNFWNILKLIDWTMFALISDHYRDLMAI